MLSIQQIKLVGNAILVTQVRQLEAHHCSVGLRLLGTQLLTQGGAAGQRVSNSTEGSLDCFFVLGQSNVAIYIG